MIDNALNLTVDPIFPQLPQYANHKMRNYPVEGYPNELNLWY